MIKLEHTEVVGWEHAIRGMRNPMNSWEKSDSVDCRSQRETCVNCRYRDVDTCPGIDYYNGKAVMCGEVGPNDHELMMKLAKGGSVHAKYRRMITVYVDITAPLYWLAEMDTYKVGTVRNSCSFMHKGVSKPFDITDFSLVDERMYHILSPLKKKTYELSYPYETDEFRPYTDRNGRTYRVYKNGLVIREAFDYTDTYGTGRTRHFKEDEATVYQNSSGYFVIKFTGRDGGHMLLHRLVASVWCDRPEGANQVNHIDGNKGNNSADNLEWVTASENMQKAVEAGLYDELGSLHHRYRLWKYGSHVIPIEKHYDFKRDIEDGLTHKELAEKWNITPSQANNLRSQFNNSENEDLFMLCYVWEKIIDELNRMRGLYLNTGDEKIFQMIRCLLPQGYMQKSTFMLNYEVLSNIYHSRKDHRLQEWRDLCKWIESLPYSEIITGEIKEDENNV